MILSIHPNLISNRQSESTSARSYRSMKMRQNHLFEQIHSKLIPAADTLQACNLTLLKSHLQQTCNKRKLQTTNHLTLKHKVWSSPFSPSGKRLRSQGSTPSLLSLQHDGGCRIMQKSRDPIWPESLADRQRHPLETAEEMVSKIMLQKKQNLNTQNVMIHYINP